MEQAVPRRAPAGAAVLREDVTSAIRSAVFAELAAVGFARMSIEGVARRAGVGKTAVYRRWNSKLEVVLDLVPAIASQGLPAPSTGSLHGDLRMLLEVAARALRHPIAMQIIPDLLVEAARNPRSRTRSRRRCSTASRASPRSSSREAVARGDLPEDTDPDRLLELTVGPLYWRLVVVRDSMPADYLDDLATGAVVALGATVAQRSH